MKLEKTIQTKSDIWCKFIFVFLILSVTYLTILSCAKQVYAVGLVDDTINAANEYSRYDSAHYQLDFYVDTGWDWLPWNWGDGIGKQVNYALYAIADFIWTVSRLLSNATGYMVQEAYRLDFVAQTADSIGKNMQTIAGVSPSGITTGFYSGFLLLFLLITGVYVAYTGLMKRETTKALRAIINFVVIFIVSGSVIAYAPDYIGKVNELSTDVSTASLEVGTKMVMPNTTTSGKDSVDLIRDSLFSIQVQQPWLLLQFGNADKSAIGESRVDALLGIHPDLNNGKDREKAVKNEIENEGNQNLSINKTAQRLGMVFFLFLFNIGISVFVFLLTGIMIFSQILFIIYAIFLPISFLMSLLPTFEGTSKRAIVKLFNILMTRAGITLIITIAFSISTMLYNLASGTPFFLIAFLQIVTFAGIFFKLNDLMSMFSLQGSESQSFGRRMVQRPYRGLQRQARRMQSRLPSIGRIFRRNTGGNRSRSRDNQATENHRNTRDSTSQESSNNRTNRVDNPRNTFENNAVQSNHSESSGSSQERKKDTETTRNQSGDYRSPETNDRTVSYTHFDQNSGNTENRQTDFDANRSDARGNDSGNDANTVVITGTQFSQENQRENTQPILTDENLQKSDNKNRRPFLFEKATPKTEKQPVRERSNQKPQREAIARTTSFNNSQERPAVIDAEGNKDKLNMPNQREHRPDRPNARGNTYDRNTHEISRNTTDKPLISPQVQESAIKERPSVVKVEQSRLSRAIERRTQRNTTQPKERPSVQEQNRSLQQKKNPSQVNRRVSPESSGQVNQQPDHSKEKRKRRET